MSTAAFLDDFKEWSGPYFDAHQLGVRLNFDVDVKILLSLTLTETNVKTAKVLPMAVFDLGVRLAGGEVARLRPWVGDGAKWAKSAIWAHSTGRNAQMERAHCCV